MPKSITPEMGVARTSEVIPGDVRGPCPPSVQVGDVIDISQDEGRDNCAGTGSGEFSFDASGVASEVPNAKVVGVANSGIIPGDTVSEEKLAVRSRVISFRLASLVCRRPEGFSWQTRPFSLHRMHGPDLLDFRSHLVFEPAHC